MIDGKKNRIRQMRADSYRYIKIVQELGISENTEKSFCRRMGLSAKKIKAAVPSADRDKGVYSCCGVWVRKNPERMAYFCG